jgi:hypothetical protein
MAVEKKRKGFGQVEPNHLSARYTGQIYAQLPAKHADGKAITQLENGQFLKYDYAAGCASDNSASAGEWMLVFNEEKLYDERYQNHRYFALKNTDFTDKLIYPRLLKTNVGDIFTTNTFKSTDATPKTVSTGDEVIDLPAGLTIGATVVIGDDGWLKLGTPADGEIAFKVVPHFTQIGTSGVDYTLGDMQYAVKLQRVP